MLFLEDTNTGNDVKLALLNDLDSDKVSGLGVEGNVVPWFPLPIRRVSSKSSRMRILEGWTAEGLIVFLGVSAASISLAYLEQPMMTFVCAGQTFSDIPGKGTLILNILDKGSEAYRRSKRTHVGLDFLGCDVIE